LPTIERFGPWAWRSLDFAAVTLLQVFVLVLTYRMLSEGRIRYRHIWGGAIVAALLLSFGKLAFTVYLSYSLLDTFYGAAGSIVVFMLWIYYSAQIVFFGAGIIKVRMLSNSKNSQPVQDINPAH
jgi:membrane protein